MDVLSENLVFGTRFWTGSVSLLEAQGWVKHTALPSKWHLQWLHILWKRKLSKLPDDERWCFPQNTWNSIYAAGPLRRKQLHGRPVCPGGSPDEAYQLPTLPNDAFSDKCLTNQISYCTVPLKCLRTKGLVSLSWSRLWQGFTILSTDVWVWYIHLFPHNLTLSEMWFTWQPLFASQ